MGEIGFIKIANLEGTAQALATAADLDQDGKVEAGELAVFNRLVGEAGLNQDKGLVCEREQLDARGTKEATPKELAKQEDKMYKECFGFKSGSADLANFKAQIAAYDSRVIAVFKQLKEAGDMETIMKLNEQIANRPDMTNYIGNSAGYLAQLDKYADAAEALLQKSDRQYQADLAEGVHKHIDANTEMIMSNDDANATFQAALTVGVGEALAEKMDDNTQAVINEVRAGNAQVIKAIKTAEGNIIHVVKTEGGQTRALITNAKNQIIGVTRDEGFITRLQEFNNTVGLHEHMDAATDDINAHTSDEARHTRRTVNGRANELQHGIDHNNRDDRRRNFNPLNPLTWF